LIWSGCLLYQKKRFDLTAWKLRADNRQCNRIYGIYLNFSVNRRGLPLTFLERLRISKVTATKDLTKLVEDGLAERIGRGRSVRYVYRGSIGNESVTCFR